MLISFSGKHITLPGTSAKAKFQVQRVYQGFFKKNRARRLALNKLLNCYTPECFSSRMLVFAIIAEATIGRGTAIFNFVEILNPANTKKLSNSNYN